METLRPAYAKLPPAWFKSYYVVWKPAILCFNTVGMMEFKSYYVVWKHIAYPASVQNPTRLNRTMQYGNANHPKIIQNLLKV